MSVRDLPSVDALLRSLDSTLPRALVTGVARASIDEARSIMLDGGSADAQSIATETIDTLERSRPHGVINATGVLLHTNLGRAPLHPMAADVAAWTACGYSNVELDLADGRRGGRSRYLDHLLTTITGAEAAMAVNNNAAALFLALMAIAGDGEVPVSRGELIEIGGSYRLPELMAASGVDLIEVGTTNRTRISDFRSAVGPRTSMLLKVHPSNYRIAGFSEDAPLTSLVELAHELDLPVVFDIGSGLIDERVPWIEGPPPAWLADEPGVRQSVEAGADLVLFSGDKLFGGPQAGIVVGRADLVERMRRHPVARAVRMDGPGLHALTVTAELYASDRASEVPFWRMATLTADELGSRCRRVLELSGVEGEIASSESTVGAGSVPGSEVPSQVISVSGVGEDRLYLELLKGRNPVVARREQGRLMVDLRAVDPMLDESVAKMLAEAMERCRS